MRAPCLCLVTSAILPTSHPQLRAGGGLGGQSPTVHGKKIWGRDRQRSAPRAEPESKTPHAGHGGHGRKLRPGAHTAVRTAKRKAGTRRSQAAVGVSVLAVLLLLELSHQAELPTAAALGKVRGHILWCRVRDTETQTSSPGPRPAWVGGRRRQLFRIYSS